ncbi:MAG: hypothetical protein HUJ27_13160 [Rhodobacteraceae bacterium]|nr:hypothetical protein [Paracoccaceae bacterium]
MNLTPSTILALIAQAPVAPRATAQAVLDMGVPRQALWPMFILVMIASVLLSAVSQVLTPLPAEQAVVWLSPFSMAMIVTGATIAYIAGIWLIGVQFGGNGSFADSLLLMTFLQAVLLAADVVKIVATVISPALGGAVFFVVALMAFWLNINFVDVLHRFGSLLKSFFLILFVSFVLGTIAALLLASMGLTISGAT